jgi:hypothetical protein
MSEFKEKLLQALNRRRIPNKVFPIMGCKPEDIDTVMKAQNVAYLPQIYKEFLLTVGYNDGNWFPGEDFKIPRLPVLKKIFKEAMQDLDKWDETLEDVFVFMDHHSYVHYFFYTTSQESDPMVFYVVSEFDKGEVVPCSTLSDFLLQIKIC